MPAMPSRLVRYKRILSLFSQLFSLARVEFWVNNLLMQLELHQIFHWPDQISTGICPGPVLISVWSTLQEELRSVPPCEQSRPSHHLGKNNLWPLGATFIFPGNPSPALNGGMERVSVWKGLSRHNMVQELWHETTDI